MSGSRKLAATNVFVTLLPFTQNNGNISSDGEELFKDGGEGGRGRLVIDTGAEAGPDLSVRALVRSNPSAHPLSPLSVSLPATAAATRDTDRESSSNVETVSLDTARSVIQVPVAASPRACSETMVPQSGLQDSASPAAAPLPRQRQSMPSKTRRKNDKVSEHAFSRLQLHLHGLFALARSPHQQPICH